MSSKPKAYSYTRFSNPEQAKGDSKRRQYDLATEWCEAHGVELDTELSYHDFGVSAYRGRNVAVASSVSSLRRYGRGWYQRAHSC